MIINIKCLTTACDKLSVPYSFIDEEHNVVELKIKDKKYLFLHTTTPFNNESEAHLFLDKYYTYKLLSKNVNMPFTKSYMDPTVDSRYLHYLNYKSIDEITQDISNNFSYPLVIKMNKGARGRNIHRCNSKEETELAINKVFDKQSRDYDYIMLAQEYIKIQKEFRVIFFKNKIVLIYEKDFSKAEFSNNLSPLHMNNSFAKEVKDTSLHDKINDFTKEIYPLTNLNFAGLDIILDENNKFYLLEISSKPGFEFFARDNGEETLTKMYEDMIRELTD